MASVKPKRPPRGSVDPTTVNLAQTVNPLPKPRRHISLPENCAKNIVAADIIEREYSDNFCSIKSDCEELPPKQKPAALPKPGRLYKPNGRIGVGYSKSLTALSKLRGVAKFAQSIGSAFVAATSAESSPRTPVESYQSQSVSTSSTALNSDFKACAFSYRIEPEPQFNLLGEITSEFSRRAHGSGQNNSPSSQQAQTPVPSCSSTLENNRRCSAAPRFMSTPPTSSIDMDDREIASITSRVPTEVAQKSSSFPSTSRGIGTHSQHMSTVDSSRCPSRNAPLIITTLDGHRRLANPLMNYSRSDFDYRRHALSPELLTALEHGRVISPCHPISCCSSASSRGSSPISQLSPVTSDVSGSEFYIQGRRKFRRAKTDLGPSTSKEDRVRLTETEIAQRAQHGPRQVNQLLREIDASSDTSSIKSQKRRLVYYYTCL